MTFAALPAILQEAEPLARLFRAGGHRVYLVGGIVRDLWLDRAVEGDVDLDLTTDALPAQTKVLLSSVAEALWLQGERFGTVGARVGGRAYEITTHRGESYAAHSRKPEVRYATVIEEDLSRRDFTVNAMAIALPDGELIDPFDGAGDLRDGMLRTPIDPDISFTDDPLRMLRAARFVTGYGLEPVDAVRQAMVELAARLDIVSVERISDELDKMLVTAAPGVGLHLLHDTGVLDRFLPEAGAALSDLAVHVDTAPRRADIRLALLLACSTPEVAERRLGTLRCSKDRIAYTRAVLTAAREVGARPVSDAAYRRWHRDVGAHRSDALLVAAAVDAENAATIEAMERTREALGEDLADFSLPLSGRDIIALLQVHEGRVVGEALAHLDELRMAHGSLDAAEARRALRAWWDARG